MGDDFPTSVPPPFTLCVRDEVGSTNDEARGLAERGAADGTVVLARRQTAGRGRRGAGWFADEVDGLAFSVVLRPHDSKALWPRLALAAGLAVAEAVETRLPLVGIKWPNDVWLAGRKVAGVLVEAGGDFAVVGIGLNVNVAAFPGELAGIASSIRIELGSPVDRGDVLTDLLWRFDLDFSELLDGVRERCVLTGREVTMVTAGGTRQGRVAGLGPGGELLLRTAAGVERIIQADEVRLIRE